MKLPPDWKAEPGGGFFPYLVHLVHPQCGLRTELAYDLNGIDPNYGEAAVRRIVYGHECPSDDCST